jgi:hypothetical protein
VDDELHCYLLLGLLNLKHFIKLDLIVPTLKETRVFVVLTVVALSAN